MNTNDAINNINNSAEIVVISKTRNKKTKFIEERKEVIAKLKNIMGLNETKNTLFLYELENNQELKTQMELMILNIKKYYKCGTWGYFSKDVKKGSGNYVNLVRAIFIDDGYDIHSRDKIAEFNNIKKRYTLLTFIKNI